MDRMLVYYIVFCSLIRDIFLYQPDGYIGCYNKHTALKDIKLNVTGGQACKHICFVEEAYSYAATSYAVCSCFNTLSGTRWDDPACTVWCDVYISREICGSDDKWSVYDKTETTKSTRTTTTTVTTAAATTNNTLSPALVNRTTPNKGDTSTSDHIATDDSSTVKTRSPNVTIATCSNVTAIEPASEDRVGLIMLVVVVVVVNVVICAVLVARHFRRKRRRKLRKLRLMNQENAVENNTVEARVPDVSGVQVDIESEYDTTLSCKPKQQCRRTENEYGRPRTPGRDEDPDYSHNGSKNLKTCSIENDEYSHIGGSKQKTCSIENDEYSHVGSSKLKACSMENDEYSHIGSNKPRTCSLEDDDYSHLRETSKTTCNKKHNIDSSDYDSIAISDTSNVQWVRNPGLQDADDDLYVNLSYNGSKVKETK